MARPFDVCIRGGGITGRTLALLLARERLRVGFVAQDSGKTANAKTDTKAVYAGAVNYLMLAGVVLCGWQMARAMMVALSKQDADPLFFGAKVATARFYAESLVPPAAALAASVIASGRTVNRMSAEMF